MGFDEKLFSLVRRFIKSRRPPAKPANFEYSISLGAVRNRLNIVAKSLGSESAQILVSEGVGGFSGAYFYFPESLSTLADKRKNEWLYICRTVLYCGAKSRGLCLPSYKMTEVQRRVYSCLATQVVLNDLKTELPAFWQEYLTIGQEIRGLLKEALSRPEDSQNGVLARWVSDLLCGGCEDGLSRSKVDGGFSSILKFWEQAEDIYRQIFLSLPVGASLPETTFLMWGQLMEQMPGFVQGPSEFERLGTECLPRGTEIPAKPRDNTVLVNLEKHEDEKSPVMHSFEKIETLEEYDGGLRTQDGEDSIKEHAEALDELSIKEVTRSRERTNSIYKADIRTQSAIPEISGAELDSNIQVHLYPEWDYLAKSYKQDWCRVELKNASLSTPYKLSEDYKSEKNSVIKLFDQVRHRPLRQKRQRDGVEFDIDALVNRHADLRSGISSEDRLYLRNKKNQRDFQCLILLDTSLSTDSWIANERVLDVIKNSVALMGEAFSDEPETIAVASFNSNTRHQCTYRILKGFQDSSLHLSKALTDVEPEGYTRIGPAIRHGLILFRDSAARHKLIFLLSDGKASDYDRYEGRYGMEDIKQTLREARKLGVHIKCLAIEKNAKFYLPQMFGLNNVQILSNPRQLPSALTSLFLPLLR